MVFPIFRLLALAGLAAGCLLAQTVGASMQGTVTDQTGAILPQAVVEITNISTGVVVRLAADEGGRWREPLLQPGAYQVRVTAPGFQSVVRKGIELNVGQDAVIDFKLDVGQTKSEVEVVASAVQIDLVSGQVSGLVNQKQMRDLPLNGRSFQQLALLETGVNAVNTGGNDPVGGRTPKISINGTRPEQSSFLLDGTDINDVYNKTPGSVGGVLLGVEAVLEFQVLTNSYSAEFGRSAGGVVNAVTRGGSNQLHGSAFEFLRNSDLDAKNFFDPAAAAIPPFKRNQFGAAAGGPVKRDRTFFFVAFESLIERLGLTGVTSVPTADARRGVLPSGTINVNPSIRPVLDTLFPLPNGRDLGGGIAQYLFTRSQPTDEYFLQGRVDHQFSPHDSLFGRYTFDNGNVDRPPTTKVPVTNTKEHSRNQYVTLNYQHTFSPSVLNTARASFARSLHESDNFHTVDPGKLTWIAGQPLGYLTVQGMATEDFGDYRLPRNDHLNNYQYGDTLFLNRGRHSVKAGVDAQRIQFNQNTTSQLGGVLTFTNVSNFLQGIPSQLDFAIPGGIDPIRGYRQTLLALFVQDDYKLRRNLAVNLGLRYETLSVPVEVNGKISNLRTPFDSRMTVGSEWYRNPSLKNFAPRLGLAWDPFGDGKTSVRAGFGLFDDELLPKYYFFSGSLNPPFTSRASVVSPQFPNLLASFNPSTVKFNLQTSNYELQNPYTLQFNTGIQRALPGDWLVNVGYSGSRGLHLLRIGEANTAPWTTVNGVKVYSTGVGRMNPNFNSITHRISDAQSFYNALQATAMKQMTAGMRAQVSYTFSRSIDDSSGVNSQDYTNGSVYVLDYWDRKADRGLSNFWAKHVLTGNASWELPLARGAKRGVQALLLKGWQWNGITTAQTGHPFTIRMGFNRSANLNTVSYAMNERPSVNRSYTGNAVLGGPDRYWDINAFVLPPAGQRGNLGRNTLIGPGLFNLDTSLQKSFLLRETARLEFRTEFFNVLNHPNFGVPSGYTAFTAASAAGVPTIAANWGVISNTVTTSRQVQFGLKLTF